jgi:hypothetical protein
LLRDSPFLLKVIHHVFFFVDATGGAVRRRHSRRRYFRKKRRCIRSTLSSFTIIQDMYNITSSIRMRMNTTTRWLQYFVSEVPAALHGACVGSFSTQRCDCRCIVTRQRRRMPLKGIPHGIIAVIRHALMIVE